MSKFHGALAVLTLLVAVSLGAICGDPAAKSPTQVAPADSGIATAVAIQAATATAFDEYPLLWLGTAYDSKGDGVSDMPLAGATAKSYSARNDPRSGRQLAPAIRSFSLAYGTCQIPPGAESCPIPISVHVYAPGQLPPLTGVEGHVTVRGVDAAIYDGGALYIETADFTVSISPVFAKGGDAKLKQSLRIANQLVGANVKAAGITKGTNFRPMAGGAAGATAAPGSSPTSAAVPATPTPSPGPPLQSNPPTLTVAVGAPSLVGGKVQVPVSTTGSASAAYAGFSVHLRWDSAVFTYASANSTGTVLASPFCPAAAVDSDGAGVTYACTSTAGSVTTTGLLATIVLAPAAAGCSPLHLFTFGAPDGGDARSGTYTVDAATSEPQAVQYADGSASVGGTTC